MIGAVTGAIDGFADPAAVREWIVDEFRLDLVGPGPSDEPLRNEKLPRPPSSWYLTGYLVPHNAPESQRAGDADAEGDLDSGDEAGGADDQTIPDHASAKTAWRPSSLGLSFLVPPDAKTIVATAIWGDYKLVVPKRGAASNGPTEDENSETGDGAGATQPYWQRMQREESVSLDLTTSGRLENVPVPNSRGLELAAVVRDTQIAQEDGARKAKAMSLFLVNNREAIEGEHGDEAFIFQATLSVTSEPRFLRRHDARGMDGEDWDERVADLQYRDVGEFAVGHNVSVDWALDEERTCRHVWTTWTPLAPVPRVVPNEEIPRFELGMENLGALLDVSAARSALEGVVVGYREWIAAQKGNLSALVPRRREVAEQLLAEANAAAGRIADGIASLAAPAALEAFRIANRAIARAARQREAQLQQKAPTAIAPPRWRPFQLAFILLNLRGIVDPTHSDRERLDLLFFPTGGGKTEAYLGLAAFTIAYRRLTHPGLTGAGVTALMRYTLRLLTLDQLGRAAAVVCALELERQTGKAKLGDWPIEIGLWVGRAATPNRMGAAGQPDPNWQTARMRTIRYKQNTSRPSPVPIKNCPWCGTPFGASSFNLTPDSNQPKNLELRCENRACDFHLSKRVLPILTVDEPIYRRLPAFMIATVDKFAGLPWTGEIAHFFGSADRVDGDGFLGPAFPVGGEPLAQPLPPPALIIQDELHLISGPLGTMVGLYEAAIDRLCSREIDGKTVRPKIVASTATVRRAERQVRALFDRRQVTVFPPPGPDRRDSFFAQTFADDEPGARHYLGIAVPGGSPKVLFLRALVTLMAAAQTAWALGPKKNNPADPYMTLLGYFNALRELGGARRIVEGEVGPRLEKYAQRLRTGESSHFADRRIGYEVMELTSRVSTDDVSEAKRRLALSFDQDKHVDVALATNMISVGLDITRLGLMVVSGQPKTVAEYIQATSRVGRLVDKPGLVVALLNVNKPRDRSHYERFRASHAAFYRGVEATSVTPFSPRALDRALSAVAVGLARLGLPDFTPMTAAQLAQTRRGDLDFTATVIGERAAEHDSDLSASQRAELKDRVRKHVAAILDDWSKLAQEVGSGGGRLGYAKEAGVNRYMLRDLLDRDPMQPHERRFRAPRSMRDVEPEVLVKLQRPTGQPLEE